MLPAVTDMMTIERTGTEIRPATGMKPHLNDL
jgi:hypothetical protein